MADYAPGRIKSGIAILQAFCTILQISLRKSTIHPIIWASAAGVISRK